MDRWTEGCFREITYDVKPNPQHPPLDKLMAEWRTSKTGRNQGHRNHPPDDTMDYEQLNECVNAYVTGKYDDEAEAQNVRG